MPEPHFLRTTSNFSAIRSQLDHHLSNCEHHGRAARPFAAAFRNMRHPNILARLVIPYLVMSALRIFSKALFSICRTLSRDIPSMSAVSCRECDTPYLNFWSVLFGI